jgi:hypothetical protein
VARRDGNSSGWRAAPERRDYEALSASPLLPPEDLRPASLHEHKALDDAGYEQRAALFSTVTNS